MVLAAVDVGEVPGPDIGARIKENRLRKGWTQEVLARVLRVSPITVSRWERGVMVPESSHATQLARYLGGWPKHYGGRGKR